MTTTPQRIDEIRDRLNKARPGLAKIDGGEEIFKRRDNPKGVYTWTLYGTYADAVLLVNAPADLAWLLGEVERLSAERIQPEQPEPTDAEVRAAAEAMDGYDSAVEGVTQSWDDLTEMSQQHYLGSARGEDQTDE